MEINISDLTWSKFIYPRGGKSEKTVEAYVEALAIGAQFPPIKIQRVHNYTPLQIRCRDPHTTGAAEKRGNRGNGNEKTEATLILDGIHRFFAFEKSGIKKIAAVEWKNKPLDYEKNKISLLLESAECNISHGDRLDAKDKKRIARDIAATDPECIWTESALAEERSETVITRYDFQPLRVPRTSGKHFGKMKSSVFSGNPECMAPWVGSQNQHARSTLSWYYDH